MEASVLRDSLQSPKVLSGCQGGRFGCYGTYSGGHEFHTEPESSQLPVFRIRKYYFRIRILGFVILTGILIREANKWRIWQDPDATISVPTPHPDLKLKSKFFKKYLLFSDFFEFNL
jgi:hypothetical protein